MAMYSQIAQQYPAWGQTQPAQQQEPQMQVEPVQQAPVEPAAPAQQAQAPEQVKAEGGSKNSNTLGTIGNIVKLIGAFF